MLQYGKYGITCYVCGNLVVIIKDRVINVLPIPGEQLGVPPKDIGREVSDPSLMIDLMKEILEKKGQ